MHVGATVIHIAYLLGHYELAQYLVDLLPEFALLPYSNEIDKELIKKKSLTQFPFFLTSLKWSSSEQKRKEYRDEYVDRVLKQFMPYTGENILHILIIQRNPIEIKWLLNYYRRMKEIRKFQTLFPSRLP